MEKEFREKYEALPRPKSYMPGPPAPWAFMDYSKRKVYVDSLQQFLKTDEEKLQNLGGLINQDLPEVAIENLGDNDLISKPSAVLVPFIENDGMLESVLVMTRSMHVSHHKGQVSFPGGMTEEEDASLEDTALRETFEEIGIRDNDFVVYGSRPEVHTRSRQSLITPVIASTTRDSLRSVNINRAEVDQLHEISVAELLAPDNYMSEIWDFGEVTATIHMFFTHDTDSNPVFIWGATAHILVDVLHCLKPSILY
jgi:8-oxo-dGTP pyrophosphatase MutT (NUDIX family)